MKDIKKLMITLVALLAVTTGAYAASVSYVDGNGTSQTVDATELESTTTSWTDGSWYIVPEGGLTISGRIAVSGTVNLILRDGTELTASAGITTTGATLNIYAQSTGTGALTATGANGANHTGGNAGIGGIGVGLSASGGAGGTVNIYGGTVTATGGNGDMGGGGGAGIGGGGLAWTSIAGSGAGGTVNIYGGTVTATGGTGGQQYGGGAGAGIGRGANGYSSSAGADGTLTLGVGVKLYNGTDNTGTVLDDNDSESRNYSGSRPQNMYAEVTVAASSGPEVAWNKAEKTGTFTMPGGNVTLEPEYYPQAALTAAPTAINDVPATTDGAIVKAGTVANIGSTETAQGTVMYYVSKTALDDAALLALAADQWTADVPTAEKLAQGEAYVYYYVRGNDSDTDEENFSDGDILAANALQVTLGAAPLWNAEFDLTDAPEADKAGKWSTNIPEGGVVKGTPVTVTYSGSKKVIGVKAEKKAAPAAAEGHALSASAVGEIVGSDGNVYAVADKDNLPEGVTAVAMVAYKSATAGSSLAIALAEEGSMNWNSAKSTCASKAAIGGKSWKLPTKDEWDQMFSANGGSNGLKTALSAAGGASSTLQNGYYWSSTEVVMDPEDDPDMAWLYSFGEGRWYYDDMVHDRQVRACLAF